MFGGFNMFVCRFTMNVYLWQIQTVAVGAAIGQACLLLAAGDKGMRYMMPHATGALLILFVNLDSHSVIDRKVSKVV